MSRGLLMGEAFPLKQGKFVLSGRRVMYMHHWLRPPSLLCVYGIDELLIQNIHLGC